MLSVDISESFSQVQRGIIITYRRFHRPIQSRDKPRRFHPALPKGWLNSRSKLTCMKSKDRTMMYPSLDWLPLSFPVYLETIFYEIKRMGLEIILAEAIFTIYVGVQKNSRCI